MNIRRSMAMATATIALILSAASAVAAIPPHQHWLITGSGSLVRVGPDVCANPSLYNAFVKFHLNGHVGGPGTQAFDIESNPVDITATACAD